jgi:hypothetical protein
MGLHVKERQRRQQHRDWNPGSDGRKRHAA